MDWVFFSIVTGTKNVISATMWARISCAKKASSDRCETKLHSSEAAIEAAAASLASQKSPKSYFTDCHSVLFDNLFL